jgi:hypothetical protein
MQKAMENQADSAEMKEFGYWPQLAHGVSPMAFHVPRSRNAFGRMASPSGPI